MQRRTRTRGALSDAALSLAATTPLDDITVTALADRAAITRETFYRYAATVADVVADALGDELRVIQEANSALPAVSPTGESVFRAPTEQLVDHLVARAAVYRNAMRPGLHPRLRDVLTDYIAGGLAIHLDAHPDIAPRIGATQPDAFARAGLVAYAASGTVGVLEAWLASDAPADRATLTEVILAAAPEWWQGRKPASE